MNRLRALTEKRRTLWRFSFVPSAQARSASTTDSTSPGELSA